MGFGIGRLPVNAARHALRQCAFDRRQIRLVCRGFTGKRCIQQELDSDVRDGARAASR